jgi:hypothetical protein
MPPASVVVFLDWQNVYKRARDAFCGSQAPHWDGQVNPVKLAQYLAMDGPPGRERILRQVRIYRGRPGNKQDPKGYAACSRQVGVWQQSPLVKVELRTLRYPLGEPPMEKGVDVALAIDFAVMAARGEYDVGILMSTDTDLRPALEYVFDQGRAWGKPRAEVAAWSAPGQRRRLSITSGSLYCHWMEKNVYEQVADGTDYSKP